MKTHVKLHPRANSGESSDSIVAFESRNLSLKIDNQCYGNHCSSFTVNFDNPDDMEKLGKVLVETAKFARDYFIANP